MLFVVYVTRIVEVVKRCALFDICKKDEHVYNSINWLIVTIHIIFEFKTDKRCFFEHCYTNLNTILPYAKSKEVETILVNAVFFSSSQDLPLLVRAWGTPDVDIGWH
jgi:hypothetical protein